MVDSSWISARFCFRYLLVKKAFRCICFYSEILGISWNSLLGKIASFFFFYFTFCLNIYLGACCRVMINTFIWKVITMEFNPHWVFPLFDYTKHCKNLLRVAYVGEMITKNYQLAFLHNSTHQISTLKKNWNGVTSENRKQGCRVLPTTGGGVGRLMGPRCGLCHFFQYCCMAFRHYFNYF